MTGAAILNELERAGVRVRPTARGLAVSPRTAVDERLRRLLEAHKGDLVASLDPEVGWRVREMQKQVTGNGALPVLVARQDCAVGPDRCLSCGEQADPSPAGAARCASCRIAAGLVAFAAIPTSLTT